MYQCKTFKKNIGGLEMESEAYTNDGKTWYWKSVNRPCPIDAAQEYGIPIDVEAQKQALEVYYDDVARRYKESRKNYKPSDEEMFEMKAAFGPNATVVDVITGQKFRT